MTDLIHEFLNKHPGYSCSIMFDERRSAVAVTVNNKDNTYSVTNYIDWDGYSKNPNIFWKVLAITATEVSEEDI